MLIAQGRAQRTIDREVSVAGVGFFTGADVRLRFQPGKPEEGIVFVRTDLPGRPRVPAQIANVVDRARRTAVGACGVSVEMIEHVMAALAGLRIDNCEVHLNAPEPPGVDGSSLPFVEALDGARIVEQAARRRVLLISDVVVVSDGRSTLTAQPGPANRLIVSYLLDYGPGSAIGRQGLHTEITPETFRRALAPSRTFLTAGEADQLRGLGYGERLTPRDLLIFGPDGPIDNELRYPDECVRHKILDIVGDTALAAADLFGCIIGQRSGHRLNARLVRKLLEAESNGGHLRRAEAA